MPYLKPTDDEKFRLQMAVKLFPGLILSVRLRIIRIKIVANDTTFIIFEKNATILSIKKKDGEGKKIAYFYRG